MENFDASPYADIHPVEIIKELQRDLGDILVIGAVAVDLVTHDIAGLPLGRVTSDIDVAVAVPDFEHFVAVVRRLGGHAGVSARLVKAGVAVDVIPFGGLTSDEVVRYDGEMLNVAGLADAYRSAMMITFGPEVVVRAPSLAALAALKLIAWADRRRHTGKDAVDLGRLVQASYRGPYGDALWEDSEAMSATDFDPFMAGPWRIGRDIARSFGESAQHGIRDALNDECIQRLVIDSRASSSEFDHQLTSLRLGIG